VQEGFCEAFDCSTVVASPSPSLPVDVTQAPGNTPTKTPGTNVPVSAPTSRDQVSEPATTSSDGGNMAGIIGGAVGVVAFVIVLGLVVWIMRRRSSQSSGPANAKPTLTSNENNIVSTFNGDASSKPEVARMPEPTSPPKYESQEIPSGPRIAEPGYVPEPDLETKTQSSATPAIVDSTASAPSSTPVASKAASYMPDFKDQARSVVSPLAVQSHSGNFFPQPNSQFAEHSGNASGGSTSSAGATAWTPSSGKKSTGQTQAEVIRDDLEIPMATAVFPVEAEHVAEVETVTSRRERLEP
jgi:hypothetical protein